MSDLVKQICELLAAATPRPWRLVDPDPFNCSYWAVMPIDAVPDRKEDAALVAAAPDLLARAADEIGRLETELSSYVANATDIISKEGQRADAAEERCRELGLMSEIDAGHARDLRQRIAELEAALRNVRGRLLRRGVGGEIILSVLERASLAAIIDAALAGGKGEGT